MNASTPGAATMGWLLGRIADEWQHRQPASSLVVDHLTQLVFVGIAPLGYVLRWRMRLAAKALRAGTRSITEIANESGYRSESAFCDAFERVVGDAPRHHRRAQRLS